MAGFEWREHLLDMFAGTVNQQTLEEAAEEMASLSFCYPGFHENYLRTFDFAIDALRSGDNYPIECINRSGYKAHDVEGALELIEDFKTLYIKFFELGED
ncbi:hypothetical protein [Pseudomonas sp. Fl4BN1]|uniref:hypothetical protein n=1 Tax=Pseudomonas sp. Fl4BN1 TaxID=2697651 RepID=UPI0013767BDE|nr:hypothetical protein [Pseudomonas sp. Fl4BN1]NBF08445.1 hypothetical protein [Pseudomonas sp. Fl4BN1]